MESIPKWRKAVAWCFAIAMPFIGSFNGVAYADEAWDAECEGTSIVQVETVSADVFKFEGVIDYDGKTFTYYSEKVLPGDGLEELNANGRTVDDSGYVRDGEGYIAVASPWGVDEIGTIVETPFGLARVYDVCEDDSYDVYTSW